MGRWTTMPAAALAMGLMVLGGCKRGQQAGGAPPQHPPAMVTVAEAALSKVPSYIDEIGKTAAVEYVTIQPQVTGQIQKIHFQDGADLKKGDVLFTIDPRTYEAALAEAKANVAQQEASQLLAKQEFERTKKLIETKAVSQQEFDQKQSALAVADAQVKAAEAAVRTAELNLGYCTITSPIDGRAGQRMVDVGNIVNANNAALLVVQRLDPIYAEFTITESDLPRVREYMAKQKLVVQVSVPGQPGDPHTGELTFLDSAVQPGAGTVRLRATLTNTDRYFWAGQFVNVRLVLEMKDAVLVPMEAIQIGQKGPFVYVVKDSTAEMRLVTEGQRQGSSMEIIKGVDKGDQVITSGQMMVAPGAKVQVAQGAARS
ncbi:MAG: efflux RND transporter periplasmic adaptor subunit [Phycisphaerales bacterium]|nr:efflux RND transporter periplasmic adaptor subunit [Phycisphaerales bacterium]